LVVAVCFTIIGLVSYFMSTPCNYDGQCKSGNWWESGWGCSCTDRSACGLNVPVKTPVPVAGAPLMFLSQMDDTLGGVLYSANLRKMIVRSTAGFSGQATMNNSGYNVGTYLALRATASSSVRVQAMLKFIRRKLAPTNDADGTVVIYPTTDAGIFQAPCTNLIMESMLPLKPFYLADRYLAPAGCAYHSVYVNTASAATQLLQSASKASRQKRSKGGTRLFARSKKYGGKNRSRMAESVAKAAAKGANTNIKKVKEKKKTRLAGQESVMMLGGVNMGKELCYKAVYNSAGNPQSVTFKTGAPNCEAGDGYKAMWVGSGKRTTADADGYTFKQSMFGSSSTGTQDNVCTFPFVRGIDGQYNKGDVNATKLTDMCIGQNSTVDDRAFAPADNLEDQCASGRNMGLILGVVAKNGENQQVHGTQMCQKISNGDGNVFGARYPGNSNDFSFDPTKNKYNGTDYQSITGVGYNPGDKFCIHALGLEPGANAMSLSSGDGVIISNNITTEGGTGSSTFVAADALKNPATGQTALSKGQTVKLEVRKSQAPQFVASRVYKINDEMVPIVGNVLGGTSTASVQDIAASLQLKTLSTAPDMTNLEIAMVLGGRMTHAVGWCQMNDETEVDYLCDETNKQNCYTPWLCRTMNGYWSNDRTDSVTGELIACVGDEECYTDGAQCLADPPCSVNNCMACSTTNQIEQEAGGATLSECVAATCAVNPTDTSECVPGCKPEDGVCMTCKKEDCAKPCGWTGVTCGYGSTLCDPDDPTANYNCPVSYPSDEPRNLVELPSAFLATTTKVNETNCLPNIFVPTPDSVTTFNNSGGSDGVAGVRSCSASDLPSDGNVSEFAVNCVSTEGNCYDDDNTCENSNEENSRFFKSMQIPGSVACFYSNAMTDSAAPDPFNYAAVPQDDYQIWASYQTTDENAGLWYMCNRVFAWVLMYANDPSSNLSLLGLSTLMNSQGMDSQQKNPTIALRDADDLADMVKYNRTWSSIQPLMFEIPPELGNDQVEYFFATIEDIVLARAGDGMIGDVKWSDSYLHQINQFVYKTGGDTQWQSPSIIAKQGIGGNFSDGGSTEAALTVMKQYAGTLVGSTGNCETVFANSYLTYGGFVMSSVIVVAVIIYWIVILSKAP
jgi:hypothetical protein